MTMCYIRKIAELVMKYERDSNLDHNSFTLGFFHLIEHTFFLK